MPGCKPLCTTCSSPACALQALRCGWGWKSAKNPAPPWRRAAAATRPVLEGANPQRDKVVCLEGVYRHADYVALNISSPNTQNLRTLQGDAALDHLLGAIAERRATLAARH